MVNNNNNKKVEGGCLREAAMRSVNCSSLLAYNTLLYVVHEGTFFKIEENASRYSVAMATPAAQLPWFLPSFTPARRVVREVSQPF